jgi:alcohol/geraniol dehydrogenase (NADP+)
VLQRSNHTSLREQVVNLLRQIEVAIANGKAARSFDFILSAVSADLPWDGYVAALRPQGKLCIVGVPEKPIAFSAFNLMFGEKAVVGGQPGSVYEIQQMLAFSAQHGIKPIIETFPMAEANAALDHTRQGKARFRAVLVA